MASVLERKTRPSHEIFDRARDKYLAGLRLSSHARSSVHGYAGDLAIDDLTLAGMKAGSHLDPEFAYRLDNGAGTRDRACRAVEAGEESVAGCVNFDAAEAEELAPDGRVVLLEQVAPAAIAELGGSLACAYDVSEEYGRKHALPRCCAAPGRPRTREEVAEVR
jgi:hypothetical protein